MTNSRADQLRWRRHRQKFWPIDEMMGQQQRRDNIFVPLVRDFNTRFRVYRYMDKATDEGFRHLYQTLRGIR